MPATINDVAEQSGVSTATVSRALRGLPNVAPSTRKKVLQVAQELNYAIDPSASRLASGHTMTIGIVMPLADQWFYSKIATAAEIFLLSEGYDIVRYSIAGLGNQTDFFQWLSSGKRVDGLMVITTALSKTDVSHLDAMQVPVVTVETASENFPSVAVDNINAAKLATRHLINLGHRQIGIISGLTDDPMGFLVPKHRLEGYHLALQEHGIEIRPELEVPGNFSLAGGAEAMVQLLSLYQPPTAVFAFSDEMAIGAMKSIRDMNLRIPEDISVIGFDDHDISAYLGLTTIYQPVTEFGERAASILLQRLKGNDSSVHPHIMLDTKLVVRSTTGPPPERFTDQG